MVNAVLLMLLTGLAWAVVGVLFGAAPSERNRLYSFFALNNIVFCVCSLALRPPSAAPITEILRLSALIVPSALTEMVAFLLLKRAMERGSQGIAWCVSQSSMVVPFLCMVAFMGNPSSAAQWAGLVLVLAGLVLLGRDKPSNGQGSNDAVYFRLVLASFALIGIGQYLRLIPGYAHFSAETMTWRLPLQSITSAFFWVVVCSAKRTWRLGPVWRHAVPYGIVAAFSDIAFYIAADAADRLLLTAIMMPVTIGSCIMLFTLYCRIFRGERLSPGGWLAVALDIMGIALLSCGQTGA